ncbi:hypothetical protein DBR47_14490 [Paucibacter sp. KBW04]|uniref:hypothetical protein n=1 Tax=Paucibacter sp. KBW04 TaxID=2153361 RepID=UPI000F575C33|nr:hypothetical protein [Paucibacter sp. KBW04]RQO57997.1 hypothetical protein DBR47_14490 [Paucibacter sp. KBW04]
MGANGTPATSQRMKSAARGALFAITVALSLSAALVVTACGGGDNEEPHQPTPKVDCKANPNACK